MSNRKPIVGGNWKMHTDLDSGVLLATQIAESQCSVDNCDVVIFPPFPYLVSVGNVISDSTVMLGAQNVWQCAEGAFTGEVSSKQLQDVGVSVVIVGHSERRHVIGESDELINQKALNVLQNGLNVTLCVGETIEERQSGQTLDVVLKQLSKGLEGVSESSMAYIVIAYEPVWAIGTGETASPEDAQAVHAEIRNHISSMYNNKVADAIRIQYGGSVKPDNALALFSCKDIDGALVGGASLSATSFTAIIEAACQH